MASERPDGNGLLDRLIGDIRARIERGEDVPVSDYEARHPELAADLRDSFPGLAWSGYGANEATPPRVVRQLGDYRIIREVGRGGMGVVYEAEQVSLGRRVALKVLPGHAVGNVAVAERFRREARAAAGLHHTNIVPVYEVGQEGDLWYYAMQFIPGQGLDLVIRELKQFRRRTGPGSSGHRSRSTPSREPTPPMPDRPHPATMAVMRGRPVGWKAQSGGRSPAEGSSSADFSMGLAGLGGGSNSGPGSADSGSDNSAEADNQSELLAAWAIGSGSAPPQAAGGDGSSSSSSSPSSSSSSVILPGGTALSGSGSGQLAYYRGIARLGHDVAAGLAYAHGRGVLHRDIKPANLLLDATGFVWITDFGLAKAGDENLTISGDILGTVRYMAPERFRGEGDGRADTYALGLTLYELLTLRPAFESFDQLHLIDQIRHSEPPRPRSLNPRIPRDLETIVVKAIEKEPRNRYASAHELAEDLRRFLDGEPVRARQIGELERVWKWMRRRPAIASLLVLTVVLLVAGTTTSLRLARRARAWAEAAEDQKRVAQWGEGVARKRAEEAERATAQAEQAREAARQSAHLAQERAVQATEAKNRATEAELNANRQAANSKAEAALAAAQSGAVDVGLFGLIDALRSIPQQSADDAARRAALGRNIEAWSTELPVLRAVFDLDPANRPGGNAPTPQRIQFTGVDGQTLNLLGERRVRRFDLLRGTPIGDPAGLTFDDPVLQLSDDGSLVVTAVEQNNATVVSVMEAGTGRLVRRFEPILQTGILQTLISPDHRFLGVLLPYRDPKETEGSQVWRFWRIADGTPAPVAEPIHDGILKPIARIIRDREGRTVLVGSPERIKAEEFPSRLAFRNLDDGSTLESLPLAGDPWVIRSGQHLHTNDVGFDGRRLVVAQNTGWVRWYDPATGQQVGDDWRHNRMGRTARLLPDAKTLAVDCDDGRVRWIDLRGRRECGPAPQLGGINRAIDPSGTILLASRGDGLAVWQVPVTLRPVQSSALGTGSSIYGAAVFDPAGGLVAAGGSRANGSSMGRSDLGTYIKTSAAVYSENPLVVLDVNNGGPAGMPTHPLDCHPTLSNDGRLIAACRTEVYAGQEILPIYVGVWERGSGRVVLPWTEVSSLIHTLRFAPDGQTLAVGMVAGVELIDLAAPEHPTTFLPHPGPIARIEWSGDGQVLALGARSGWTDDAPGVSLWDRRTGKPLGPTYRTAHLPYFVFLQPDAPLLVLDRNRRHLARLDPKSGRLLEPAVKLQRGRLAEATGEDTTGESTGFGFRPDGLVLAEASGSVAHQYDSRTGRTIGLPMKHSASAYWLKYSPDGQTIASLATDGSLRFWDAPTGLGIGPAVELGAPGMGLAFTPDGTWLTTFTVDGRVVSRPVPPRLERTDPDQLALRLQVTTGFQSSDGDELDDLSIAEWRASRAELERVWPKAVPAPDLRDGFVRWYQNRTEDAFRLRDADDRRRDLDQLARLQPDDWQIRARHADINIEAGRLAEGEATYATLRTQAPAEPLVLWLWSRGVEHLVAHRVQPALWYLDRVVAARPDDWRPLSQRAEALHLHAAGQSDPTAQQQTRERAQADQDRLLTLQPDPHYVLDMIAQLVRQGRWGEAGALAASPHVGPTLPAAERALLTLLNADPAPVEALLKSPRLTLKLLEYGVLAAINPAQSASLAQQLTPQLQALEQQIPNPGSYEKSLLHGFHQLLAGLHYRAGQFDEAREELRLARARGDSDPGDEFWLCLLDARQQHLDSARQHLETARTVVQAQSGPLPWTVELMYHIQEVEAERTLREHSPAPPTAAPNPAPSSVPNQPPPG